MIPSLDLAALFTLAWSALASLWLVALAVVALMRGRVDARARSLRFAAASLCKAALGASAVLFGYLGFARPDWAWAGTLNLVLAGCALAIVLWHNRHLRRDAAFLCKACDYDLRGLPEGIDVCPECGTPIPSGTNVA